MTNPDVLSRKEAIALTSEIRSKLKRIEQKLGFEACYTLQHDITDDLKRRGYHDEYMSQDVADRTYIRNYLSYHVLIGSTPRPDIPFIDFEDDASIISFLDKKLAEVNA